MNGEEEKKRLERRLRRRETDGRTARERNLKNKKQESKRKKEVSNGNQGT